MSKLITVNDKLLKKINRIISEETCLTKTDILVENKILPDNPFDDPPEFWTKEENIIYEFLTDLETRLSENIKKFLLTGNAR